MCTMSVIRTGRDVLRIVFNRDELLTRPPGLPPMRFRAGRHDAIMPVDPQSQGTWIAASDAGLVLAVLNVNDGTRSVGKVSRGRIIPQLLDSCSLREAIDAASELVSNYGFGKFRLIAIDRETCGQLRFDGRQIEISFGPTDLPMMFTSSGLGDSLVDPPRRKLFHQLLGHAMSPRAAQDEFHRHCWPDRPHLSVRMSRADARTVSQTLVEVAPHRVSMNYRACRALVYHAPEMVPA
jgi:hypothetical protein